jgi:hypothetical protein
MQYEEALQVWEEVIAPACATVGLVPVRADGLTRAGEITDQVFRRLRDDDVVIADLTGANANVMYELGMRHTRDSLTVQIGEYGRLPFDVNVIRTVLFSRSAHGLINARNELSAVLTAGLAGEYDQISVTRIWNEADYVADEVVAGDGDGESDIPDITEPAGFLDLVAEGEEQQEALGSAMNAIGTEIEELGQLAEQATAEMAESDARGAGMRGRLVVTTRFSGNLDELGARLENHVSDYELAMRAISSANMAIIGRLEEDPAQLADAMDFATSIRSLAVTARESLESIGGMVDSMQENARLSRVLRTPTRRIANAVDRFAASTQQVDEWDRRLQALGVPIAIEEAVSDPEDGTESS